MRVGMIGTGAISHKHAQAYKNIGYKLAVCTDIMEEPGRRFADQYGAQFVKTYEEVCSHPDVDFVDVCTFPDFRLQPLEICAKHGKHIQVQKPISTSVETARKMIETARATNRILQVGSQRVSSIIYVKAKELLASGAIGQLNMVNAHWDRNSAMGAWNYTVPLDASTETCDWNQFLGSAPKIPFNAEHFFKWRKWKAYGTGVAGDLFVHLFSGTHFITGSNGPTRAMATGGLRFWKDGRDANDVLLGLL